MGEVPLAVKALEVGIDEIASPHTMVWDNVQMLEYHGCSGELSDMWRARNERNESLIMYGCESPVHCYLLLLHAQGTRAGHPPVHTAECGWPDSGGGAMSTSTLQRS